MDPLNQVLAMFHNPFLLVGKRRDKLLDYDSLRHDLDRTVEPERLQQLKEQCTMAKRCVGVASSYDCHMIIYCMGLNFLRGTVGLVLIAWFQLLRFVICK